MGVQEDIERLTTGIRAAQHEVNPWLDRLAAGQLSPEDFDKHTKRAQDRMAALEHELDMLRSQPGDLPATELDAVIADVESSLMDARRRQLLLGANTFSAVPVGAAAHRVVTEQIRELDETLARLKLQRDERIRFTRRAMFHLERAVVDDVIDQPTMDRLRPYLE